MFPPRTASRSTVSSSSGAASAARLRREPLRASSLAVFADVLGSRLRAAERQQTSVAKALLGDHLDAFVGRVGDLRGEEADGAQRVVVAGDDVVDDGGVAVGVDDGDDRDAELAGFGDGDGFVVGVDDEDARREGASWS